MRVTLTLFIFFTLTLEVYTQVHELLRSGMLRLTGKPSHSCVSNPQA